MQVAIATLIVLLAGIASEKVTEASPFIDQVYWDGNHAYGVAAAEGDQACAILWRASPDGAAGVATAEVAGLGRSGYAHEMYSGQPFAWGVAHDMLHYVSITKPFGQLDPCVVAQPIANLDFVGDHEPNLIARPDRRDVAARGPWQLVMPCSVGAENESPKSRVFFDIVVTEESTLQVHILCGKKFSVLELQQPDDEEAPKAWVEIKTLHTVMQGPFRAINSGGVVTYLDAAGRVFQQADDELKAVARIKDWDDLHSSGTILLYTDGTSHKTGLLHLKDATIENVPILPEESAAKLGISALELSVQEELALLSWQRTRIAPKETTSD